jgi:hypothetical protein
MAPEFQIGDRDPRIGSRTGGFEAMSDRADAETNPIGEYLSSRGGPFYEMQRRLGLLHEHALNAGRRAVIFVALGWGVPLLLSIFAGHAVGSEEAKPYLLDFSAWARFFIATGLFTLTEQEVEAGLRAKLDYVVKARILSASSVVPAAEAVTDALKRRNSRLAEIICLVLAYAGALAWYFQLQAADGSSWAVRVDGDNVTMTLAGLWALIFSVPLFYFLLFRGFWRYIVWAMLLSRISSLQLRLVASHPDGRGGIGFLAEYPNVYAMFVFGLSSAVAVPVIHHVFEKGVSSVTFGYLITGWLVIVLALFGFPLLTFTRNLNELKDNSLRILGAQATDFFRQAERNLTGQNAVANNPEADPGPTVIDPSAQFAVSKKLSVFLMSRAAVIPIGAAALIPFAIAGATKLPYKEVFALVKKLLVL